MWRSHHEMGGPLCVVFPEGTEPLLFCSKYRNETAYSVVFATLFAARDGIGKPHARKVGGSE